MTAYTGAVLTISDKGSRGEREDTSGPQLAEMLSASGFSVMARAMVPDDVERIREVLLSWTDQEKIALILTTGGTGVAPRDLTPEATGTILEREIPGIAEAMRAASLARTRNAILSRGLAGIRKQSLIINLPGSKKAARENLEVVLAALPHAIAKIRGDEDDCDG
jgi:molybdenum cofactor synthesis domain-containing protein